MARSNLRLEQGRRRYRGCRVIEPRPYELLAEARRAHCRVDRKPQDLQTAVKDLPASRQALCNYRRRHQRGRSRGVCPQPPSTNSAPSTCFYNNAGIEGDIARSRDFAGDVSERSRRFSLFIL